MKNRQNASRLFLVELVVDLALFVLCAAVCVALLVHARSMSSQSTRLTHAVYAAQTIAEAWKQGSDIDGWPLDEYGLTGSVLDRGDNSAAIVISNAKTGEAVYVLEEVKRIE